MLQLKRVVLRKYVPSLCLVSSGPHKGDHAPEQEVGEDSHVRDMVDAQYRSLVCRSLMDLSLGALLAHTRPSISKQSLRASKERARDLVESQIDD